MKLGLMGGTFDPIHYGHLVAAEEVRARLGLKRVLFIPAGRPPHKLGRAYSPAEVRVRLVELGIASNPKFSLSLVDVERPGPSYSVETLTAIREEWGAETDLYFIVGSDSLHDLLTWKDPERLVHMCHLAVVSRPAYSFSLEEIEDAIPDIRERVTFVPIPEMGISSSDLRARVQNGMPIKYQVPEAVEGYIYATGLYRSTEPH